GIHTSWTGRRPAMRTLAPLLILLAAPALARCQDARGEAAIKPDAKALTARFKVTKERYDPDRRRYVWGLEAKESSDATCFFDAEFQDPDDREVTRVKVEFEDGGRQTVKGQTYRAEVKYPTRKTMEKVTQIVVKKSDG